jgi:phosphoribosylformylglycinamidine synthase
MAGELGMEVDLSKVPGVEMLTPGQVLYSESCGRFIVTVAPDRHTAFEAIFSGMALGRIGLTTELPLFIIRDDRGSHLAREDVLHLKNTWKRPFGGLI